MNFFNDDNLSEKLNGLIKIGEVCEIDVAKCTARVVFDDDDGMVSNALPVLQRNTIENKDYAMPDIGEDVVCVFLSSGMEEGFILGSIYAGEIMPPESDGNKRTILFKDGTKISYDRNAHELTATIEGVSIKANRENIEATAPKNIIATAENIEATATKNLNATAGAGATIKAPSITLDGEVSVTGNLSVGKAVDVSQGVTAGADVVGAGISLQGHTHTGNQGSPTSPPL